MRWSLLLAVAWLALGCSKSATTSSDAAATLESDGSDGAASRAGESPHDAGAADDFVDPEIVQLAGFWVAVRLFRPASARPMVLVSFMVEDVNAVRGSEIEARLMSSDGALPILEHARERLDSTSTRSGGGVTVHANITFDNAKHRPLTTVRVGVRGDKRDFEIATMRPFKGSERDR